MRFLTIVFHALYGGLLSAQGLLTNEFLDLVLIRVQNKDEGEIKKAFDRARAVRKLNPQAKELADMYFFETLVRIHRAGE